jgi:predicted acylesterase/phospholipase RssA
VWACHREAEVAAAPAAAACRYTYFVGVMDVLVHKLGCVGPATLLSGASCGALIAVFTKCGLPVETVLDLTQKFSHVSFICSL